MVLKIICIEETIVIGAGPWTFLKKLVWRFVAVKEKLRLAQYRASRCKEKDRDWSNTASSCLSQESLSGRTSHPRRLLRSEIVDLHRDIFSSPLRLARIAFFFVLICRTCFLSMNYRVSCLQGVLFPFDLKVRQQRVIKITGCLVSF